MYVGITRAQRSTAFVLRAAQAGAELIPTNRPVSSPKWGATTCALPVARIKAARDQAGGQGDRQRPVNYAAPALKAMLAGGNKRQPPGNRAHGFVRKGLQA